MYDPPVIAETIRMETLDKRSTIDLTRNLLAKFLPKRSGLLSKDPAVFQYGQLLYTN